jgi:SAM-dependent methyltransferase
MRSLLARLRSLLYRALAPLARKIVPEAERAEDHWQRIEMNRTVAAWIEGKGPAGLSAAEISGANHAGRGWGSYTSLNFPEFDLLNPVDTGSTYDVVICEQVLEHVIDPVKAARTLNDLLVPGGIAIVSTPFMIKVHELPQFGMFDYWRFTPRGLEALLERAGFEVETVGSWGNRECLVSNLDGWARFKPWMPMHDEPDIPQQVWAFARKT